MRYFRQYSTPIALIMVALAACSTPTPVRVPTITPTSAPPDAPTQTAAPLPNHRTAHARFAGTVASICPSAAHQLLLDLVPCADIRFTFEPSGFQLHLWNGNELVTHSQVVEDFPVWGARD